MLIVGAKGFAKELLEVCRKNKLLDNLVFLDTVSNLENSTLYDEFPILTSFEEAKHYFGNETPRFVLGLGDPLIRKKMTDQLENIGGELSTIIDPLAEIAHHDVSIMPGATILSRAIVSNGTKIGRGALIYHNAQITHDCSIGDFVELSPGATLLGHVKLGNYVQVGANATILPKVEIGDNVIIGAGAVVTKDIPAGQTVVGVPAKAL